MSKQSSEFPDQEEHTDRTTRGRKRKGQYVLWEWVEYTWINHKGHWWKVRAYEKLSDAEQNKKRRERDRWFKNVKCVILPPGQRP